MRSLKVFMLTVTLLLSYFGYSQTYSSNDLIRAARTESKDVLLNMAKNMKPVEKRSVGLLFDNLLRSRQYPAVRYLVGEKGYDASIALKGLEKPLYHDGPLPSRSEVKARVACKDVNKYKETSETKENLEMVQFLINQGGEPDFTVLIHLIRKNDLVSVKYLYELGGFTEKDQHAKFLENAIEHGNIDLVRYFIEEQNFNFEELISKDRRGALSLSGPYPGLIDYFLKKGANPNRADSRGWSVIFRVAKNACPESTLMVLEAGADPHHKTNGGVELITYLKKNIYLSTKSEIIKIIKKAQKK